LQFDCSEQRHLPGGFPVPDDTVGTLLTSQMMFRLPGLEHIQHGIDMVTGQEGAIPIFAFHFCDNTNVIQDTYRGLTYQVPVELSAIPYPTCDYSTDTKFYSSSHELAQSESKEKGTHNLCG
jgi:hypothetical protein